MSPPVEERLQHPDSSTLEEVNNNNNTTSNVNPPRVEIKTEDPKAIKNYDGNFVLLLPEHHVQLANALGVNLRQPSEGMSSPGPSSSKNGEDGVEVKVKMEKPLDYSKGNEQGDSMWRPW